MTIEKRDLAHEFIDAGNAEALRHLLAQNGQLSEAGEKPTPDSSLLLHAIEWPAERPNLASVVKVILDAGGDRNQRVGGDGESALHWAASVRGLSDVVQLFVDADTDLNPTGGVILGGTPIMNALYFGHVANAKLLRDAGAFHANVLCAAGLGDLHALKDWYAGSSWDRAAFSTTGEISTDCDVPLWLWKATVAALVCHQYDAADWLLENCGTLNAIGFEWSLLHHAAYSNSRSMAVFLIDRGADVNVKSKSHNATPVGYAGVHGSPDVMSFLINAGAYLPLGEAIGWGRLDRVLDAKLTVEQVAEALPNLVGLITVIGKPLHPEFRSARIATLHYLLQRFPTAATIPNDGKSFLELTAERDPEMHQLAADLISC